MRIRPTAASLLLAPLALALSACGGDAEEVEAVEDDVVADSAAEFPAVGADARNSVDWAGTYEQRTSDGLLRTIRLSDGEEFTMTDAEGVETSGTFNWYSDNSRILIKDGEENMVFAVADGALYRLAGPEAGIEGPFDESRTWRRSINIEY